MCLRINDGESKLDDVLVATKQMVATDNSAAYELVRMPQALAGLAQGWDSPPGGGGGVRLDSDKLLNQHSHRRLPAKWPCRAKCHV